MSGRRAGRRGIATLVAALCLLVGSPAGAAQADPSPAAVVTEEIRVPGVPEPDGIPVELDVTIHRPAGPAGDRRPVVLIAHGFGGSKADADERARALVAQGYLVVAWTARGFGASGGRIHLDDPAFEGADVRTLVDLVAARPDVLLDAPADPRLAIIGGSYGGAIGLIAAAVDARIDTVVAAITWHDLAGALFPQAALAGESGTPAGGQPIAEPGPVRQLWISRFFGASLGQVDERPPGTPPGPLLCGRFDPTICRGLLDAVQSGTPGPEILETLRAHGPAAVLDGITVPVLLVQGMADSLFGLDQSDATARALIERGVPVAQRWIDGGHDGASSTATADDETVDTWLRHYLLTPHPGDTLPVPAFAWAGTKTRRAQVAPVLTAPAYPGVGAGAAVERRSLQLITREDLSLLTPPGGAPASITAIPGAGEAAQGLPTHALAALPGQSVAIDSRPVPHSLSVVGSPHLRLRLTSSGSRVTLFASLWQVQGRAASQPRALVAPLSVPVTPGVPTEVTVALPAATWTMPAGSRWRVLLTSTDSAFANPREARLDRIEVLGDLTLPVLTGEPLAGTAIRDTESIGVGIAIGVVLLGLAGTVVLGRRRRAALLPDPDLADVPLAVTGLVKTYADGHRAVDDVTWRAEKGQVVGLLGPNGAGKTTTIRMVLGLIAPDAGVVHVMGQPVGPGADILTRVGALVEGPGFLPHLTGRENLRAYWRATGRPESEAGFAEALDVAALGGALDRPVRTYSHGMKQRLGIAQAMLGLPDLLILDEPTNGLDPPQIAAMRPILHAYAAAGRTVVISSHLLGEVEQTCSHVVVMHAGRVITTGAVADLVASADTTVVELGADGDRPPEVAARLRAARGIRSVDVEDDGEHGRITVVADRPRGEVVRAVIEAGGEVVGVGSRRHLEEVFLGVIAQASPAGPGDGTGGSLIERLRQVRAR